MPDIIHLLPDSVANQIAAGEVIQRPASVIKELVENSLDAGASYVEIVIENAGKSLIQVIDDGKGMSATDARLAFERHATSKITKASDLFSLHTMGFRGEALPSIAAVAQVELRTRTENDEIGTCINIEGSRVTNQSIVVCKVGANFAVRNLFFNIPARRKFLKSNQTELTNILAEIERIALPHPDISFKLYNEGNTLLDLPTGNFRQRIIHLFGRKTDSQIVPVEANTSIAHIKGFVGLPAASRRKNAHQFLFANGRFMRHPYFTKAILTAYERLIPEGQQVPFFISIKVDPARIDLNIHPTKTEIKFEDDGAIFQIILAAVREALGKYGAVPTIDFDTDNRPNIPYFNQGQMPNVLPPQVHIDPSFNPFEPSEEQISDHKQSTIVSTQASLTHNMGFSHASHVPSHWEDAYQTALHSDGTTHIQSDKVKTALEFGSNLTNNSSEATLYDSLASSEQQVWQSSLAQDFMQYQGRYIITPLKTGLAIIDQHRAHIRILYEQYMRQLQAHNAPSQRVLFPEIINLSPSESVMLNKILPQLQEVGFDISPLGTGSYSILAMPAGAEGISPTQLVSSILADAIEGEANASETIAHIISFSLARKVAIPIGQLLSSEEMAQLIEQLFTCSTPNLTPDGTLTLVICSPEKMF